ncbi:LOW QUALITY PROTEIN: hypothetical protein HID58_088243, partial [Brassica napus]
MAESPKYIEPYDCREAVAISPKLSLSFVMLNPGLQRIPPVFKPSDEPSGSHVRKSAGPFDALICVGQFFPDSPELLDEFLDYAELAQVLIPTYFTGDYGVSAPKILSATSKKTENQGFKMDGLVVAHNLFWLRGRGKFTLHGLSVAYLSGTESSDGQFGNQDDVDALRALADDSGVVDFLFTNEWPVGVTNRAAESDIPAEVSDSSCCDSNVRWGVFYAREPYLNVDSSHVTRFLCLAQVGNKNKQVCSLIVTLVPRAWYLLVTPNTL